MICLQTNCIAVFQRSEVWDEVLIWRMASEQCNIELIWFHPNIFNKDSH